MAQAPRSMGVLKSRSGKCTRCVTFLPRSFLPKTPRASRLCATSCKGKPQSRSRGASVASRRPQLKNNASAVSILQGFVRRINRGWVPPVEAVRKAQLPTRNQKER